MSGKSNFSRLVFLLGFISIISEASGQCPWDRDPRFAEKLSSTCLCKTGPPERQTLSIQCQRVDFPHLIGAMQEHAQDVVISALLVHNSTSVGPTLSDFLFKNLKIISLQISHCGVREISDNAFRGLENTLQNLNLEGNELRHIPVDSLRLLRLVSLLDLTENRIHFAPDNAFVTLRLKTLKLGGNNVTLSANALRGQETSLKNLNLKNCQLKEIPAAVLNMNGVTFLDLAQNNIRILRPGIFRQMHNLTALNLEQNLIPALHPGLFEGVTDSLTSLSLLNNLLPEYPIEALLTLKQLRVSCVSDFSESCTRDGGGVKGYIDRSGMRYEYKHNRAFAAQRLAHMFEFTFIVFAKAYDSFNTHKWKMKEKISLFRN